MFRKEKNKSYDSNTTADVQQIPYNPHPCSSAQCGRCITCRYKTPDLQFSKWNEEQVENWLEENQIDFNIQKSLEGFNGEMLKELHNLKRESPDYFYSKLDKNDISLKSIIEFTMKLNKLSTINYRG